MWNYSCNYVFFCVRPAFICLLFFFAGCTSTQYINRTYGFSTGFTWESLDFNSDSTFTWIEGSCIHHGEISGNYQIEGRKLILRSDTLTPSSQPARIHHSAPVGDSCLLSFTLFSQDDTIYPLIGAIIILRSQTDTLWKQGMITNFDGVASLKIHKQYFPVKLETKYLGHTKNSFLLNSPVNTSDSIFLAESGEELLFLYPFFPQEYQILRMDRRKLHLVRTSPQIIEPEGNGHPTRIKLRRRKDTNEQ
jgi:hypothetical protein